MDLHEQYIQCAECACRLLCEEISASLPLELREMIYEQILRSQPPPHCWSAAYLGDECFEEFMSTYHRINTFKFIVGHPIQSLLHPDSPVELSRLQSVGPINVDLSFSARLAAYSTLYPKHIETKFPYLATLVANLRELTTFKTGMRITINIDDVTVWAFHRVDLPDNPNFKTLANTSDEDIRKLLFNINADLFPEFENLKEAGHRLTFFVKTQWAKLKLPGDMALSTEAWFPKLKVLCQGNQVRRNM
jgi:hypothetical protein